MKGIFLADKSSPAFDTNKFYEIFSEYTIERLSEFIVISPFIVDRGQLEEHEDQLSEIELIFSTWGIGHLSEEEIRRYFPKLKAVFYAAGTVKFFAEPFFNCGIRVFSSQAANAVPVAEFTLAHILLANKGIVPANTIYKKQGHEYARSYAEHFEGNFHSRVGILGAGRIGKKVIELLKPFSLDVLVFDPYLSFEEAARLGVVKTSLEMIFSTCHVISSHLANNDQTKGIIDYDLLCQMNDYTTIINTAAGEQINTNDLLNLLQENTTITAVLDVTQPEPLPLGHPFHKMDNVFLSPRISGSVSNEVARMGEYMVEECLAYVNGKPLKYEITPDMLSTLG